jgi:hypothetical protein
MATTTVKRIIRPTDINVLFVPKYNPLLAALKLACRRIHAKRFLLDRLYNHVRTIPKGTLNTKRSKKPLRPPEKNPVKCRGKCQTDQITPMINPVNSGLNLF